MENSLQFSLCNDENFTFLIGYGIPAETGFLVSFSIEFQNGAPPPFENYRGRPRMERLLNRPSKARRL